MFKKADEKVLLQWIRAKDYDAFGKYLLSGEIHGKPGVPVSELNRIGKILSKHFSEDELFALSCILVKRSEYAAKNVGLRFLHYGWPKHKRVEGLLKHLAGDDDWIVRECAAGAFSRFLEKDFEHFSKTFAQWVKKESVNVKRAISLAVKYDSYSGDQKKWPIYFRLIDPLMSAEEEYIRKNLGPFAIGDGLIKQYPEKVLTACQKWSKSKNEHVRWNTAMIFTAAAARKSAKEGKLLLKDLLNDELPYVSRAAKKALANLNKS